MQTTVQLNEEILQSSYKVATKTSNSSVPDPAGRSVPDPGDKFSAGTQNGIQIWDLEWV